LFYDVNYDAAKLKMSNRIFIIYIRHRIM